MKVDIEEGIIELEIAGKERILKFGMRCSKLIAEHSAKNQKDETASTAGVEQLALFFWAALKAKESVNDLPQGFDLDTALDWMDDLPVATNKLIMAMGGKCLGFIELYSKILTEAEERNQILQQHQMQKASTKLKTLPLEN